MVAYLWPQTPQKLKEQLEKNPLLMGMTAETKPIDGALVFPDGTKFDTVDDPEVETLEKLRASIKELEGKLAKLEGK